MSRGGAPNFTMPRTAISMTSAITLKDGSIPAAPPLTAVEAVYFSLATLTTAGFGDPVPLDDWSRLLTASELVGGLLLLLFLVPTPLSGVSAMLHKS
jgi:hypothetical protein